MNTDPILPGATVGILGSGQLGRMLALQARDMGYGVRVFSPEKDTPCGQIADTEIVADYRDTDAVRAFARTVSVATYEFENVPSETVSAIESVGVPVRPGAEVLYVAQNRLREKNFFRSLGIATPPFARIASAADVGPAIRVTGLPAVLKTAGAGYDGKGQRTVRTDREVQAAFAELGGVECILEGFIDFAWEGSVVAARGISGDFAHYGLVRNDHANHILDVTTAPAPESSPELVRDALDATRAITDTLGFVGLLGVEFFVTSQGTLIANEMAPRPHNSGHWTMNGAVTSQFEQQLRAVCGLPLGATQMPFPGSAIANLLGDLWDDGVPDFAGMLADFPDAKLYLYGKSEARPGRKMGHINVAAGSPHAALERVLAARDRLR
ncbi:MAG: 5-(carboxyamino)imidazole ribonucleotide synthase [Akkermansiaceae bacterium]|nr:5-(carboxyamino)imidazole ribonucleotide synthase [Armatimonadota bacterium]